MKDSCYFWYHAERWFPGKAPNTPRWCGKPLLSVRSRRIVLCLKPVGSMYDKAAKQKKTQNRLCFSAVVMLCWLRCALNKLYRCFMRRCLSTHMQENTQEILNASSRLHWLPCHSTTPERCLYGQLVLESDEKSPSSPFRNMMVPTSIQTIDFLLSLNVWSSSVKRKDRRIAQVYNPGTLTSLFVQLVCKAWQLLFENDGLGCLSNVM